MTSTKIASHRLYVVTGKGGTGKTSLALALTSALHKKEKNVKFVTLENEHTETLSRELKIPSWHINVTESTEEYIGRKLHSPLVAAWVMKTPFFEALFQIVPGLSQMIMLGHIIDELEKNPDLTLVLDAPATGHAISMFESINNFRDIFESGAIFNDIIRMKNFMKDHKNLQTLVILLPQSLATEESVELTDHLTSIGLNNHFYILNSSLIPLFKNEMAPDFLKERLSSENSFKNKHKNSLEIPFSLLTTPHAIVDEITEVFMESIE